MIIIIMKEHLILDAYLLIAKFMQSTKGDWYPLPIPL